jgi:hypothetical protein
MADARVRVRSSLSDAAGSSVGDSPGANRTDTAGLDLWGESGLVADADRDPAGESNPCRAAGVDGLDESWTSDVARLDPWGEPVNTEQAPRFKWRAGAATREEAARFAVWGDNSTSEGSNQPNPSEGNAAPNRAAPSDPWDDATLDPTANATLNLEGLAPG